MPTAALALAMMIEAKTPSTRFLPLEGVLGAPGRAVWDRLARGSWMSGGGICDGRTCAGGGSDGTGALAGAALAAAAVGVGAVTAGSAGG
jgi:hypothetical protein